MRRLRRFFQQQLPQKRLQWNLRSHHPHPSSHSDGYMLLAPAVLTAAGELGERAYLVLSAQEGHEIIPEDQDNLHHMVQVILEALPTERLPIP